MPTEQKWSDVLRTTSPLIVMATAGCMTSNLLQVNGDAMTLGAGLGALGFGTMSAGVDVLLGVIANRFHDHSKVRAFDPQSLLQNEHLYKLTALAIKAKLLEAAKNDAMFLPSSCAHLRKMAANIEAVWEELRETLAFNLVQAQLVNAELQKWFLEARDNPEPTALTVEHWAIFLRAVGLKHDCLLDADKLTLMAERLHSGLAVALRELLKDDFANGGEAFAALLLRMLADIYGAVQDVQRQSGSDPALLPQMQQLLTKMRLIGGTVTQRFDELPTRDEWIELREEIRRADDDMLDKLNIIEQLLLDMREENQAGHATTHKHLAEINRALSGARPRLQPFTPPKSFPSQASRLFGRKAESEKLLALLHRNRRVAITGDGGLGKTALAAEVLHDLDQRGDSKAFQGGLYLHDFYQQPTFAAFVQTILVHSCQSGQSPEEQIALAAEVLKRPGTFVYLEGAEKLAELPAVLRLLDGNTHLLLTTREPKQADGMKRLTLRTIELRFAAQAVQHYAEQFRFDHDLPRLVLPADDPGWHDLARDLGGHALGCKLAGELCGELAKPPAELHTALAQEGLKILAVGESSKDNLNVLFRQSALAFCAQVEPEPCAALRAWQALTFAGTNLVPRGVLHELGVVQDDGLRALIRRGLVISELLPPDNAGQRERAYWLAHALLAEWARTGLAEFGLPHEEFLAKARAWGETLLGLIQRSHCVPGGPSRYSLLAPLAEGLLREVQRLPDLSPGIKYTFYYLPARMHHLHANFLSAEPLYRAVLTQMEATAGTNAVETATALNNLAGLLEETNRPNESEPLKRRALAIFEKAYGPDHPQVAIILNNLAQLLQATNRLAEAEPMMRRALAIDEQSYGAEHPRVARDLNNLAGLLMTTNRLAEAEPLVRRALAIDEQSYGTEHARVAIDINNLAVLFRDTNRLAKAEPLFRRALAIDEQSYGAEHPHVAIDLNNLAWLLKLTNRLAEAEPLMRRALAIDEQSYGADHPKVAFRLNNLAQLLQDTNHLAEAEPLMRRALEIFWTSLGDGHPNTVTARRNLDDLLTQTGNS